MYYYYLICILVFVITCLSFYKKKSGQTQQKHKQTQNKITIVSWNTNGVIQNSLDFYSRFSNGLKHPFFQDPSIDILCLQEIFQGVKPSALDLLKANGFDIFHHDQELLLKKNKQVFELSGLVNCCRSQSQPKFQVLQENNFSMNYLQENNFALNVFQERTSFDILAQKGFLHSKTESGVHIINLHLQSILREMHLYDTYCFSRISIYQRKQLKQLFTYLRNRFTHKDKVIIVGDFNINPFFDYVNGVYLSVNMARLGFKMRPYDIFNYEKNNNYDCKFLDHVWYRNMKLKSMERLQATKDLLQFSDHLPVKTCFTFSS